ncbi:hypothetical protein Tco_0623871 [Tanacetum coccineum]|uniref:Retrovirus-related Pol polyprotein from transposon TNT 1-94-like beta-barrel domain-containing protein n=1 Tax=Tanacetum coccineum TaxID=301880 RepID=A0ABQ4WCD2_9ASTR
MHKLRWALISFNKIVEDKKDFDLCLKEEMVADLKYVNSLEDEVDNLKSQMETQKTQLLNEIDRLSREYYYADHMEWILLVKYTDLDEFTDLPMHAQTLPQNRLQIVQNTNVIAPGMYKVHTKTNQTRTPQLHQDIRKPNKRVSFLYQEYSNTSVCRPQLKSIHLEIEKPMVVPVRTTEPKHNVNLNSLLKIPLVEIVLFIVDSGCSKHMTKNLKILTNFVEKFLGMVKFGNDQIAPILVLWRTCSGTNYFQKGNDLLTGSRGQICIHFLHDHISQSNLLMAKANIISKHGYGSSSTHLNIRTPSTCFQRIILLYGLLNAEIRQRSSEFFF